MKVNARSDEGIQLLTNSHTLHPDTNTYCVSALLHSILLFPHKVKTNCIETAPQWLFCIDNHSILLTRHQQQVHQITVNKGEVLTAREQEVLVGRVLFFYTVRLL